MQWSGYYLFGMAALVCYMCPRTFGQSYSQSNMHGSYYNVPTSAPNVTTTAMPTTTGQAVYTPAPNSDCPSSLFCNNAPSESAYLQGPFNLIQTFLLFSGSCVLEYNRDYTTKKINVLTAPQLIQKYLQASSQPTISFTGPVTIAYDTLGTGANKYVLNLVNPSSDLISCNTDPNSASGGLQCSAATPGAARNPQAAASSASSQLDTSVNQISQYVVTPDMTELALYVGDFNTKISQSSGFLTKGQTKITKITGIQIIQDQKNGNPSVLAVYGTGNDGVAYVGYADATLLTGVRNAQFPSAPFIMESVPLAGQFQGKFTCP